MKNREKIGLISDEGGDLPKELIAQHQVSIVPFKIDLGEMKNIPGNIYQKIREAEKRGLKSFVKTSQPSPGDFLLAFKEKLMHFGQIICITITSKHSGTFNSALQARNFLPQKEKVHIVDSLSGSGGEGLIILKASSLIKKGLKAREVLERLKETISRTHLIAMLQDPKWLQASGRLPPILTAGLKGLQKIGIRPLIGIKKGKIKLIGIKKGFRDLATPLFKEFEAKISPLQSKKRLIKVAITHADNLKEVLKLKEMVERVKNTEVVFISLVGNILGGLVGPGTIALAWQEQLCT